jgi:hypothetical protein
MDPEALMVTIRTAQKLAGLDFSTKRFVGVNQFHKYFKGQCVCGKALSYGCLLVDIDDQGYTSTRKDKNGVETTVQCYTSGIYVGTECIKHVAGNMSEELKKAVNEFKRAQQNEVETDPETVQLSHETMSTYYALTNFFRALQQNSAEQIRTEHDIDVKELGYACNRLERARHNIPNKPANVDTAQAAYRAAQAEFRRISAPFVAITALVDYVVAKDHSHPDKAKLRSEILEA